MASRQLPASSQALTAPGGADGYATVASNAGFWTGSTVTLMGPAASPPGREARVTETPGTTRVGLLFLDEAVHGTTRSNLSAYPSGSVLTQPAQATEGDRNDLDRHGPPEQDSGGPGGPATQIVETGGPTTLSVGAIADGQATRRVGTTFVGYTPTDADERVKISNADTTTGHLVDKLVQGSAIVLSIVNPGFNEELQVDVSALATDAQHGLRGGGTQHAAATTTASGFMSAADKATVNQLIAAWDITKTRYWLIDYDGGNDANVGYVDATAGSTIAPAGLALKTMERFYQLCPVLGNGRASVVLQKLRAAGANYLKIDGVTLDSIDNSRFKGYQIFQWRASTDLTNSLADRITCGFMSAVAGPNGDQSFTVDVGATTTVVPIAAGSLGADPACVQFRARFSATTATVALRNQCRVITANTTTQMTVAGAGSGGFSVAPAAGDTFFIERPGVRVDQITHDSRAMSPNGYKILARQHSIIGIATTSIASRTMTFSGPDAHITGCEQVTLTNSPVFLWHECIGGGISEVYFDDAGVSFNVGMGLRLNCSYAFQFSSSSYAALGMMNPTASSPLLSGLTNGYFGPRSYFARAPIIQGCGGALPNGIVPFMGFSNAFIFGETFISNANSRVNSGGLSVDASNIAIFKLDFTAAGAVPGIKINSNAGSIVIVEGCTGSTGNTDVGIDLSNAAGLTCIFGRGTANTLTGTAGDIRLPGPAITTHAGLATTNVVDRAGNSILGSGDRTVDQCSLLTNVDGTALAIGELVRVSATNNVVRAKADVDTNISGPLFVAVTPPANNAAGYFVPLASPQKWVLHDVAPTLLALSYASPGTGGSASTTIPTQSGTNQKRRLGHVAKVSGSLGLLVGSPELLPITADGSL